MNDMKRSSPDEVPNALWKRQRHNDKPTRVNFCSMVEVSRALGAIPGELGAGFRQKILEKKIDGDQLMEWLNFVEAPAAKEEPVVTDVFCKHSHLFLPFLDRVSWNHLCSAKSQIYNCSRSVTPPWPQKLLRVDSPVDSVAFSSDGECLACASEDTTVRVWNKRNGSCTLLEGHTEDVRCISFSPDGKILASGGVDRSIRLWKLEDQSHRLLEGHDKIIRSIAFSPSGLSLASGCYGGEVRLWDVNDGRCTRIINVGLGRIASVAFSPDGSTLATSGKSSIFLWDLEADDESRSFPRTIETDGRETSSLVYSSNGIFLASVVDFIVDSAIKIWRTSDGSLEKDLGGSDDVSISLSPNGKLVASGNNEGGEVQIRTMDGREVAAHACEEVKEGNSTACVNSVAFTPDGQTLASGGCRNRPDGGLEQGFIFLWDTRKFV
jgi:WD40 repeat protein